jgi:hypothetical protein
MSTVPESKRVVPGAPWTRWRFAAHMALPYFLFAGTALTLCTVHIAAYAYNNEEDISQPSLALSSEEILLPPSEHQFVEPESLDHVLGHFARIQEHGPDAFTTVDWILLSCLVMLSFELLDFLANFTGRKFS